MTKTLDRKIARRPAFTEEQKDRFLDLISDGFTRQEAAEQIQKEADAAGVVCHSTSTRWKGLYHRDEVFAERYAEALESAGTPISEAHKKIERLERVRLAHRIFDEAISRALDPVRGKSGASNRVLHNIALLTVEDYRPLLEARTRHIHEGAVGVYALPHIDTDRWTIEQHERFMELERERNALLALARPDGAPVIEERPALTAGEVVDDPHAVEVE